MTLAVIFGNERTRNSFGSLEIDVTLEETHERSAEITDHPVEGGSFIQDHIVNAPKKLMMTGMITDTPLGGDSGPRAQEAFDVLETLYDSRSTFTVVSGFKVYDDMAIESLSMPKTREGALRFSAQLKQLRITQGRSVPIVAGERSDPALTRDNVRTPDIQENGENAGRQTPREAGTEQTRQASTLRRIFRGEQ
jgi:hypothetical protein